MSQRYNDEQVFNILALNEQGWSSRKIATELGISKSGVNYLLARSNTDTIAEPTEGARFLFMDFETSAALVYCFGRHKQFINQDAVVKEGGRLLMGGYAYNDDPTEVFVDTQDIILGDDYAICKFFHDLIFDADVIVAHNLKGFDLKMLNNRMVANGLPPLNKVQMIDTLEIAKKHFRLPSNKLDSIAAYYNIGRKVSHEGMSMWVKVQAGDQEAIDKMVEYCHGDVQLLREVFYKLRSSGLVSAFNAGHYFSDGEYHCRACGSINLGYTGRYVYTPVNKFKEVRCFECGYVQRDRKAHTTKDERALLLT